MRIAVLGTGGVGQALSAGLGRHGHEIRMGTRDPGGKAGPVELGAFADVAGWCELAILATAGTAAVEVARQAASALAGKVLVDATNPLEFSSGGPMLFVGTTDSLGEQVQRAAPEAHVVKAYNTVGAPLMVDPQLPGRPTMFVAGDDAGAKQTVAGILADTGWDVADLGDITASRWLEAMCMAWVLYGSRAGTWDHAFALLHSGAGAPA